jgi:hypothetical protein
MEDPILCQHKDIGYSGDTVSRVKVYFVTPVGLPYVYTYQLRTHTQEDKLVPLIYPSLRPSLRVEEK